MTFTAGQQKAKDLIDVGKNVFVSGEAGVGKSYLINNITDNQTILCAPTGAAALQIGGVTLSSLFALPLGVTLPEDIHRPAQKARDLIREGLLTSNPIKRMVIDEISMCRADHFELIDTKLKIITGKDEPFGGIQLVGVGDLGQLPPVLTREEEKVFKERYDSPWCFKSQSWTAAGIETVCLTEVMRQEDAKQKRMLTSLRLKDQYWGHAVNRINQISSLKPLDSVWLCAYNKTVSQINKARYSRVQGTERTYLGDNKGFKAKDLPVDEVLRLKVGTKVLIKANHEMGNYVNGTQGEVVELSDDYVVVHTDEGTNVAIEPMTWEKYDYVVGMRGVERKVVASFTQLPIKLGYGISIHACIPANSIVQGRETAKPIKDVAIGDYVWSGHDHKRVVNKWTTEEKKVNQIKTEYGFSLDTSYDHRILVCGRDNIPYWKRAEDVAIGEYLCLDVHPKYYEDKYTMPSSPADQRLKFNMPASLTEDLSYMCGVLIGDGCYSETYREDYRVDITSQDEEVLDFMEQCWEGLGMNPQRVKKRKSTASTVYAHSKGFRSWLSALGFEHITARDKKIPDVLKYGSWTQRKGVVSGMIDTDGSTEENKMRYVTISENLANDLKEVLLSLGILSYILTQTPRGNRQKAYTVHVTGQEYGKLRSLLGLRVEYKRKNLSRYAPKIQRSNKDVIPFSNEIRKSIREYCKKEGIILTRSVPEILWRKKSPATRNLFEDTLYKTFPNITEEDIPLMKYLKRDFAFMKVKDNIQTDQSVIMYDIEVEEDHSFVADNFVVHNCQGTTLKSANIDFGYGAFCAGQAYVALSRVRNLENMYIKNSLKRSDIITDLDVINFYKEHSC